MKIPPPVREAAAVFAQNGSEVYLVGGALRDSLRGKAAHDYDLAVSMDAALIQDLFRPVRGAQVIPTGIRHGTVTLRYKGLSLEITTFRTESGYSDGRRPDSVAKAASIEEDLSRRDFTMNAIALELPGGKRIVDPFGGREDIKRRVIRAVGDARARFAEDGLRPLRALRFAAQTGFAVDEAVLKAIPDALDTTAKVSPERVRDEFDKTVMAAAPVPALLYMEETGLLRLILPELAVCRGVEQKGRHAFDVLDHSFYALEYAAAKDYPRPVRLAALFHDIGKPPAAAQDPDGTWTFYLHDQYSAEMTESLMRRLRYPNHLTGQVVRLVKEHMFNYDDSWGDSAVRRFIIRAGEAALNDLFMLRLCDTYAIRRMPPNPANLAALRQRIETVLEKSAALGLKDLAVNGDDLIAAGIAPGKRLGIILNGLLQAVIEDPALNTREKLLVIALNLHAR
ncbi:MAG: HD domain-containing protein [Spirochaetaceae bacterium]|jgi:putative nucleotidyltransferase with HDIG domain|nr:HD domain-containing protein [Spirochaetaceae bacterium]